MLRRGGLVAAVLALTTACQTGERLWRISPFENDADGERVNLWPIAYHSQGATSVLWPLFDIDSRGFALRPLVANDGSAWSVLFPLAAFDTAEGTGWCVPFYVFDDAAGLFPLANFGSTSWVGPVWWRQESGGLFPLAHLGELNYVGPVWWRDGDDGPSGGLFPLAWFGSTSIVGPVWWGSDEGGFGVFPLFGRDFLGQGITHVGPLWWQDEPEESGVGLFPLAWYGNGGRSLGLLPFYHQRLGEQESSRNALLGLAHFEEQADGHTNWILPLWLDRQRDDTRDTALLPFYWKHERGESARVYTLLGNHAVSPDSRTLNLYPLWWSNESGDSSWRMLFPLFWFGRDGDERTLLTPLGGRGWSESGDTAFVNVLGPLYHHSRSLRRDEERTAFLWPLYSTHRVAEERTTTVGGLWTRTRDEEGVETVYLLGLGHAREREEGSAQRLWPFYSWNDGLERPGFVYDLTLFGHERDDDSTHTRLFPLFSHERGAEGASFDALLGLVHHDRASDQGETRAWPLFGRSYGRPAGVAEYFSLWGSSSDAGQSQAQLGFSLLWSSYETETAERRTRDDRALLLFTHDEEETRTLRAPDPEPDARANRVSESSSGFLFDAFLTRTREHRVWREGELLGEEARALRAYDDEAARAGVPDAAAVREVLARRGITPGPSQEELRGALADFIGEHTRTYESRKIRVPLLFGYEREDDELDWYGPLGLVRYRREPARTRFSLLYYVYRSESDGQRTQRDLFPFLTWDTGPGEKNISFLWRLFHYERHGERRGGHVLFIPWGSD